MQTPYVTPAMLINAPFGISWATIPQASSTTEEQLAEQTNIAIRASALVDEYCNQPLRATMDVEKIVGPDYRMTVEPSGVVHALTSRWPIIEIVSARYSAMATFPRQWTSIDASKIDTDESLMPVDSSTIAGAAGVGPSGVYIAPGYLDFYNGRRGYVLELTYINGWPHAGFTAATAISDTTIKVDDVTGFAGAVARIYDGGNTEMVTVASTDVTYGPGTLTLSAPLTAAHASGTVISTLPGTVQQATLLFAASIAMERGSTAIEIPEMPGAEVQQKAPDFATEAEILLHAYQRVI